MKTALILLFAGAALAQEAPPKLALSLEVDGLPEATVYRGWPAILQATVRLEEGAEATLATRDAWTSSLKLSLTGTGGKPAAWPIQLSIASGTPLKLQSLVDATALFTLTPEDTRALTIGRYTLRAELDTLQTAADGGWKGVARSRLVALGVEDEPPVLPPEYEPLKALVASRFEDLRGDKEKALAILNSYLEQKPGYIPALTQKAGLLDDLGRTDEAALAVAAAIEAFRAQFPDSTHPPRGLIRLQNELNAKLEAQP